MPPKKDAERSAEELEEEVEDLKEDVEDSVEESSEKLKESAEKIKDAVKKPGKTAESVKRHVFNPFSVTLLLLSLVATASFFLIPTTITDLIGFNFTNIFALQNLVVLLLPLPFAFVAIHSLERFRKESFAAIISLLLIPLGGKLALAALTLSLGCPLVSWKARSVYNKKNKLYTFYKATGTAVTVVAVISAALFVGAFTVENQVQGAVTQALANKTGELSEDIISDAFGGDNLQTVQEQQIRLASSLINSTETVVLDQVRQDRLFTGQHRNRLDTYFSNAHTLLLQQIRERSEEQRPGFNTGSPVTQGVNQAIDELVQPTAGFNLALFLIVFSLVLILRLPFAVLGTVYAYGLVKVHRFLPDQLEM